MPYIIAFTSQAGNTGKSLLAATFAVYAQRKKRWPVRVVDMDVEHRSALTWHETRNDFELKPSPELVVVNSLTEALQYTGGEGLVVFDCPSRATRATADIAAQANLIVVPVTAGQKDADLALDAIHKWHGAGTPLQRFRILFTRQHSDRETTRWRQYLGHSTIDGRQVQIMPRSLPEKQSYRTAYEAGCTLTETPYNSLNQTAEHIMKAIMKDLIT